jgi:hypothetical protein
MAAVMERTMAEQKPRTLSTKLHADVVESARIVAAFRGDLIADLLSNILRPILAKMEQEEMVKRTKVKKGGDQ